MNRETDDSDRQDNSSETVWSIISKKNYAILDDDQEITIFDAICS